MRFFQLAVLPASLLPLVQAQLASPPQQVFSPYSSVYPKRIAIIGAGSAGSSTAYFLQRYALAADIPVNITIYDSNTYIGGRSTTINAFSDPTLPALELGASIFVSVNRNLVSAANELNLSTSSTFTTYAIVDAPALGVYDGIKMILLQSSESEWWDLARLVWRYGLAPYKTLKLMRATVAKFLSIYESPVFPFRSLTQAVRDVDLADVMAVTGEQWLLANGVTGAFGHDVVQASTRVNYATDLNEIHGLEAMVCMATDGAMSVEGGNWRIFDGMVSSSGAVKALGTKVSSVRNTEHGALEIVAERSTGHSTHSFSATFDEVVLATPWQYADISWENTELEHIPDKIPYVDLHVTIFTSKHLLDPVAFGMNKDEVAPTAVLTTTPPVGSEGSPPDFQSVSLLDEVINPFTGGIEHVYKIFTKEPVTSTFFGRILGLGVLDADAEIDEDDIRWVYRKLWQSYPVEYPRVTFEEIKLAEHIWYTSGIESFISTMETSSLMGMNVARLMVDGWLESSTYP